MDSNAPHPPFFRKPLRAPTPWPFNSENAVRLCHVGLALPLEGAQSLLAPTSEGLAEAPVFLPVRRPALVDRALVRIGEQAGRFGEAGLRDGLGAHVLLNQCRPPLLLLVLGCPRNRKAN